jgi:hypothetical protein
VTEFDVFWSQYPLRRAKFAAQVAYRKARTVASAEAILIGVDVYRQHLPDDPQYICRPATFLNQGRWLDEYEAPVPRARESCPHTPECHNRAWCLVVTARERGEIA